MGALRDAVDLLVGGRKVVCNSDLEGAVFMIVFESCREETAEAVFVEGFCERYIVIYDVGR